MHVSPTPNNPGQRRQEFALQKEALEVQRRDVATKEEALKFWRNPVAWGLLVAALGLAGNAFVTLLQNRSAEKLARQKFQYDILLESMKTTDPHVAAKELQFFLSTKYLDDPDGKILAFISKPTEIPLKPPVEVQRAELESQLEQLRRQFAWRHINRDKFLAPLRGKPKPTGVTILYLRDDSEAWNLSQEFFSVLTEAEWPVSYPEQIQPNGSRLFAGLPSVAGVGGNAFGGIALVANDFKIPLLEDKVGDTAFAALTNAILYGLGVQVAMNKPLPEQGLLPPGAIRIVIGPKMDPLLAGTTKLRKQKKH